MKTGPTNPVLVYVRFSSLFIKKNKSPLSSPLQFPSLAAAIILLRISLLNSGFVFQYQFLNFSGLSWYFRKCYLTKERSAVSICFDATSDQLCTQPMKLKWKISPSLHDGVEKLQHLLCHFCIHHLRPAQWMYDELARIIYRDLASVHLVLLAHGSKWWQVWVWSWGLLGRWCRWAQTCKIPRCSHC